MPSRPEQAMLNLEQARALRASGWSYRDIGRKLDLTACQVGRIRRALKRAKAAQTRLHGKNPDATARDLPVGQSVLPPAMRQRLTASGYRTLGDLADRLAEPDFPGLESMAGIGPHGARLINGLLDYFELRAGRSDLQSAIEDMFPELRDTPRTDEAPDAE